MPLSVAWPTLWVLLAAVLVGGLVKGVAGFGYAVTGTALLAVALDPATAVTLMILPTLVANLPLVAGLGREAFADCLRRFWPFLAAALAGTLAGMAVLGSVPRAWLGLGLGLLTLGYVLAAQPYRDLPVPGTTAGATMRAGAGVAVLVGLASGLVFGASNVAVQVVAYLDRLGLDRTTFVGVLAMVLVGISTARVGAAWTLGLYGTGDLLGLSVLATAPGVAGVVVGSRLRPSIPARYQTAGTLALLAVIGARLTAAGVAGL